MQLPDLSLLLILVWKYIINKPMKQLSHKLYAAFTLVELLVVITLLAILWTIGTLVFLWNIAEARDAARNNDLVEITNVLHLFESEFGEYPIPSENTEITFSWALAWNQWVFWDSVWKEVRKFGSNIPTDPKFGNYYSYSVLMSLIHLYFLDHSMISNLSSNY